MKASIWAIVALVVLGLVGWRVYEKATARRSEGRPGGGRNAAVAVLLQPVRKETIRDIRMFTGSIRPKEQFVVAPKVPGRLERLLVNIGDVVRDGDLLALLDSQEYGQQVEQARAELDVAKANVADAQSALDIATRDFERASELRKQHVASQAEMDQADARCRAAQAKHAIALAQVKQREAALKANEVRLAYTRIVAAWEGGAGTRVIGERYVDEGAMLRANDPIVSVLDLETVIATIFVIERDYPHVEVGQTATVATDAFPGRQFSGKIARKAPLLKESSRQAQVEIEVANPEHLLAPGMFVRAEIQFAAHEGATVVPVAALVRRNGDRGVFLADPKERKAHFVPVTVGVVSADAAEIQAPSLAGQVVTLGQHLLEDGAAIVLPEAGAGGGQPETPGQGEVRPEGGSRP